MGADQNAQVLREPLVDVFPTVKKPTFKVLEEDAEFGIKVKKKNGILSRIEFADPSIHPHRTLRKLSTESRLKKLRRQRLKQKKRNSQRHSVRHRHRHPKNRKRNSLL